MNDETVDILTQEEIDGLLVAEGKPATKVEDKRALISRMLHYVMLASDEGMLALLSHIEHEADALKEELFEMAVEGEPYSRIEQVPTNERMLSGLQSEEELSLYRENITIVLGTIKCLYEGMGLSQAALVLEGI